MSTVLHIDLVSLVGSWRLVSHGMTFTDTDERVELFGPAPDGRMVLASTGRIMFLLTKPGRQPAANDAERAVLFTELTAYTGMVRPDGPGRFITAIDVAANPAWTGHQLRLFNIEGNRLTIEVPPQPHPRFAGRIIVGDIVFVRE